MSERATYKAETGESRCAPLSEGHTTARQLIKMCRRESAGPLNISKCSPFTSGYGVCKRPVSQSEQNEKVYKCVRRRSSMLCMSR